MHQEVKIWLFIGNNLRLCYDVLWLEGFKYAKFWAIELL